MSAEETNKEVIVAKAVTASIIWLPNRSVESHFATEIRPIYDKNGLWLGVGGGWGGGGTTLNKLPGGEGSS